MFNFDATYKNLTANKLSDCMAVWQSKTKGAIRLCKDWKSVELIVTQGNLETAIKCSEIKADHSPRNFWDTDNKTLLFRAYVIKIEGTSEDFREFSIIAQIFYENCSYGSTSVQVKMGNYKPQPSFSRSNSTSNLNIVVPGSPNRSSPASSATPSPMARYLQRQGSKALLLDK